MPKDFVTGQRFRVKGKADPPNHVFRDQFRYCEGCIVANRDRHGNYILHSYTINGYDVREGLPPLHLCKICYKKIKAEIESNKSIGRRIGLRKQRIAISRYWLYKKQLR